MKTNAETAWVRPSPLAALPESELLDLLDSSLGATVSVMDGDFRFRYVNAGFAEAFRLSPQAMVGMSVQEVYGEAHYPAILPFLARALAGETVAYERKGSMRLQESIWRTVSLTPWRNAQGEVIGIVTVSMAVHELKATADALREANERLSSHMDNSPLSVLELDAQLRITRASSRVTRMFGWQPDAVVGQPLAAVLGQGQFPEPLKQAFGRLQSGEQTSNQVEGAYMRTDDSLAHFEWFNSALLDAYGHVSSIMTLIEDVSARAQAQAQLRHNATHDLLTGLLNRNGLAERLADSLTRASRSRQPVALLFIDLDGFKAVNDQFGHASGDAVLCEVTQRLLRAVRETDGVARFGGDEFVVLLDTEVLAATPDQVCQRILKSLQPPCVFKRGQSQVGASIGVAMQTPSDLSADDLLKQADMAMFEAKRAGKGCVRYYG